MGTSKLYTRLGDNGTTALAGGERVSKASARIEAGGAIDEANAWVGAAGALAYDARLKEMLTFVQHKLYACSCCLACEEGEAASPLKITEQDVTFLEKAIDRLTAETGAIKAFVLSGGTSLAATLHLARTVVRRAERRLVALAQSEPVDASALAFVNRLSDLLFQAARYANHLAGVADVISKKWFSSAPSRRPRLSENQ